MARNQSHSQNVEEIQMRIDSGQLQTYFNRLSRNESSLLSKAIQNDEFPDIANILIRNLSSYGRSLEAAFLQVYEDQIKQLAESLIDETIEDWEEEIDEAVESKDFDKISKISKDIEPLIPVSEKGERVVEKLNKIAIKVRVPFSLKSRTRKIAKEKDFEIDKTTKAGVYESWSNKKPAFTVFHHGKIVTWHNITKKQYEKFKKARKVIVDYTPTSLRRIKPTPKVSKKELPFSNKEKIFIQSRGDMSVNEIYSDYLKKFGRIRPKGKLLKEIRRLS